MSPHGDAGVPAITDLTTRQPEASRAVPLPCHKRTRSSVGFTVFTCRAAEDGAAFLEGHGQVVAAPAGEGSAILLFVRGHSRRPRPADCTLNRNDLESALAHDDGASARAKRAEFGFRAAAEAKSLPAARRAIPGQRGRFDRGGSIPAGAGTRSAPRTRQPRRRVNPRGRGEQTVQILLYQAGAGPSPRGEQPSYSSLTWVHPRGRGEQSRPPAGSLESQLGSDQLQQAAKPRFPQVPTCCGRASQRIPSHFQGRGPQRPRRQSTRC